ncbi:MAG TPA: hypothetical protein PKI14_15105 [Fervidobacterium sp.]|nr:hypothetical protein [Fervidobacterium sp.]HOM74464.1 hypothetical protein [Fervidobacterium sp.]HOQ40103.1 hypothetical protein [Fervidobacterium sp.]HPT54529.1 hypothetical protein [Fervidobacterium sp.]HPZ18010.1 hypothetical protein [Fervidobacterium sp.]
MVKAIINGEEKDFDAEEFQNFGEFLRKVLPEGQVLKTLKINDKDVPVAFIEELKSAKMDEDIKIELELVDTVQFLKETLNDVLGYIEHVKSLLSQVSDNLLTNNEAGWKAIKDLSDGISAMENLKGSTQQITKLSENELNLVIKTDEVMKVLKELLNALDIRDNLEVSDIVRNKVPTVLDYYIEYFGKTLEILNTTN